MPGALDWLMQQLGGDPEAEGAAQTSTAMQPAVLNHLQNVLSDMPGRFGGVSYDSNRSLAQNAKDLGGVQQAVSIGMQVGPAAIRAYHGSPHDFDAFDISKIGTGEGAQAYGHGLYFAESPDVARAYREKLSGPPGAVVHTGSTTPGVYIDNQPFQPGNDSILRIVQGAEGDPSRFVPQLKEYIRQGAGNPYSSVADAQRILDAIVAGRYSNGVPGRMYEVDLHADPATLLDWDKPLIAQNPQVQRALKDAGIANPQSEHLSGLARSGDDIYDRLVRRLSPTPLSRLNALPLASQQLREAGIPGVKYLDQGSRSTGEGTSNYVMFDDKLIEILRKYGLAGLTAGAGGAAALGGGAGEAQAGVLDRLRQQLGEPPT